MGFRGERLRQARTEKGYSQGALAKKLGINYQQIYRWEQGGAEPQPDTIVRLAELLDCTTDWLLGRVAEPNEYAPQLTPKERQLLELYRRGEIPTIITDLVAELARRNPQKDLVVDGEEQAGVATQNGKVDS